jgi:TIR domain
VSEPLRIFVSYRRTDAPAHAGRLYDRLINSFDEANVFMDVDTIEPGLDFRTEMQNAVGKCDAFVAVIGKKWTGPRLLRRPRIESAMDYVRVEVEAALARKIRVIPMLVEEARLPAPDDLPGRVKELPFRNALRIRHTTFHTDATRLVETLEKLAREKASGVVEAPPEPPAPLPVPPRIYERRRSRLPGGRALAAGAAAVAVAGGAAAAVWLLTRGGPAPPKPVPPAAALKWTLARGGPEIFGGDDEQVAAAATPLSGGRAEAVGFEGRGERRALAWRLDGGRWSRDDAQFPPQGFSTPEAVAASGSVIVAAGRAGASPSPTDPAVWVRDSTGWRVVCLRDPSGICTGGTDASGVSDAHALIALKRGGFVVVGTQVTNHVKHAAVWTSSNGDSWAKIYDDPLGGEMDAVVAAGRALVAVGSQNGHAAAWIGSADGMLWRHAPKLGNTALVDISALHGIALTHGTLVAGGADARRGVDCTGQRGDVNRSAVLTSTDGGGRWTRRFSPAFHATGQQIVDVVAYANRFVALGFDHDDGCNQVAAAWTSASGTTWKRTNGAAFRPGSQLNRGAVVGRVLVATGNAASDTERDATIWNLSR